MNYPRSLPLRNAIAKAKKIISMLQGTMGLESQGLSPGELRKFKRETIRELWLELLEERSEG